MEQLISDEIRRFSWKAPTTAFRRANNGLITGKGIAHRCGSVITKTSVRNMCMGLCVIRPDSSLA